MLLKLNGLDQAFKWLRGMLKGDLQVDRNCLEQQKVDEQIAWYESTVLAIVIMLIWSLTTLKSRNKKWDETNVGGMCRPDVMALSFDVEIV